MTLPFSRIPVRLSAVVVLAAMLLVPWHATRISATFIVLAFLPGLALLGRRQLSFSALLGTSAALSPVLFGFVVLALLLTGMPAPLAAWCSAAGWALAFILFGGEIPSPEPNENRIARATLLLVVIAGAAALLLPLTESWWRVRADSWFHAAVFHRLANQGLPLADPYFSPLRLQYMYFYHCILVGASTMGRLDPFFSMILVNGVALTGSAFAFQYLGRFFARAFWPRVLGTAMFLFGMNGLFYLFYPIRLKELFFGDASGAAVLEQLFPWSPAGHETAIRLISIQSNQFLFLEKFTMGTTLTLSLGLVCLLLARFISARRGWWSRGDSVLWVVVLAGLLYAHVFIGVTSLVVTLGLLALLLLIRSETDDGGPSYARLIVLTMVSFAIAAPYIYSVSPKTARGAIAFAIQPGYLVGLLSSVLPALILSIPLLRWTQRRTDWERVGGDDAEILTGRMYAELSLSATGVVVFWIIGVALIAFVVDLPAANETKFSYLLFIPLAALAVGGLNQLWHSRRGKLFAVTFAAASILPLNAAYYHHAVRDSNTFEITTDEEEMYAWIRNAVPADAIFFEESEVVHIPVLAGRDQYWGTEDYAYNWGYHPAEIITRRGIRDAIYSGRELNEYEKKTLRALNRKIYVVYRVKPDDLINATERFQGQPALKGRYGTPRIAVWELSLEP